MALHALARANHSCECDRGHYCFPRRRDGKPYTEAHHLIPLCFYDDFDVSIDVPENIVSLWSGCHKEIHFGKEYETLVKMLYEARKQGLEDAGIKITIETLLDYYRRIFKKKR